MIGVLNAYHFDTTPGCYQEEYLPMMLNYLKIIMPQETIRTYEVAQGVFPKSVDECKGWIITGSPASAYDDDQWIKDLIEFTQKAHEQNKKILGICFGHQLIAHALGGEIENSNKGWGVGVREFNLQTETPLISKEVATELNNKCALLFSHQDQVIKLPPNAVNIAGDDFCPHQIYAIDEHIFSIQGHPEFTVEYAKKRYDARIEKLGEKVHAQAIKSLTDNIHHLEIGKCIKSFFS